MGNKVLIVGGVAAGASAAARLRRLDETAEIIMFERGEHISFANCGLPYYVGGIITNRNNLLVQTPQAMQKRFNIEVRNFNEVLRIYPGQKQVEVKNLIEDKVYREDYDYLVLCPGANTVIPDIPGIDKANIFLVKNVPDSDIIKQYIDDKKPEKAVVIGGGFIGLEMAEILDYAGVEVTMVEASPQLMAALDPEMAAIVHDYIQNQDIELYLSDQVISIEGSTKVEGVKLKSGKIIPADMVVLGIGVKPNIKLAQEAGLTIGSAGGIWVDEYLKTSDPYIYAAGDAIQVKDFITGEERVLPLAGPANRQGWLVANNILGRRLKYKGVQGSAIVKIVNMTVAVTGKNEKTLKKLGLKYQTVHIHPSSHATYYPGSNQMTLKLLFTPQEGKILGAQIVGYDGVDKRIDVLATAIRAGMNVFDLQELELAYAPPFSSAKDPVNMAAYAAGNMINGDVEIVYWDQVPELIDKDSFLLDVRTPGEFRMGAADGAYNIPVDALRNRLDELPEDKIILTYCRVGIRSYIATRILNQKGYKAKNISGGYKLYEANKE